MTKLSLTSMAFALACALAMPIAATAPASAATTTATKPAAATKAATKTATKTRKTASMKSEACTPSKKFECKKVCTTDKNKKEQCTMKRVKKKA